MNGAAKQTTKTEVAYEEMQEREKLVNRPRCNKKFKDQRERQSGGPVSRSIMRTRFRTVVRAVDKGRSTLVTTNKKKRKGFISKHSRKESLSGYTACKQE